MFPAADNPGGGRNRGVRKHDSPDKLPSSVTSFAEDQWRSDSEIVAGDVIWCREDMVEGRYRLKRFIQPAAEN
jgi:hypothetical protein